MNSAHLHALLVDRACGELPPEVEALLADYLAHQPAAAREAAAIDATLGAARHALLLPVETHVPALAVTRRGRRRAWLPLAACLVAGAAFGWLSRAYVAPSSPAAPAAFAIAPAAAAPAEAPRFWSAARFAAANGIRSEPRSQERAAKPGFRGGNL
jgi:hypothetical protein